MIRQTNIQTALPSGLTENQAAELMAAGRGNVPLDKRTRSIGKIIFDNVFTLFNFINAVLGVVVLLVSLIDPRYFKNLLFMGVVVANTFIYSFQEIRAKLAVDNLAILTEPHATIRRDGQERSIPVAELVPGDVQHLAAGQQIPIDGRVLLSDGLEVDEALLTGESNPVRKQPGQDVLSGSVVMSGEGYIEVTKVSKDTFAAKIVGDAKREGRLFSPLMRSLNKILKYVSWVIFPLGVILIGYSYITSQEKEALRSIVTTAGLLVSMLPEGLVLLTSVALAVAVVRLGQKRTLVQTVPSVETLARVDVLCLDKTGTITTGEMTLLGVIDLNQQALQVCHPGAEASDLNESLPVLTTSAAVSEDIRRALQALSLAFPGGNATQEAISEVYGHGISPWKEAGHIAFSSKRKWSGASFQDQGSWYIGAAEALLSRPAYEKHQALLEQIAEAGYRVIVLGHNPAMMTPEQVEAGELSERLEPRAILVIADEIRPDVAKTLGFFYDQGVQIKIISGDHPKTLSAIAKRAGISGRDRLADMSQQPEEGDFRQLVNDNFLFGRVSPFQKRQLLKALQDQGHVVAMTGDGVNDVLALKDADCGVAMSSGSEAARAVADIVLLDNEMGHMVEAVAEGRRVINNIQRVASLFLIKTTYAILFALSILPLRISYPILPIQGTIINSLTVGIPSFILALKPNQERVMGRFLANVMPLAWPAGLSAALMLIFLELAQKWFTLSPESISTYGTFMLIAISLRALFAVSRPFDWIKRLLFVFCTVVPFGALLLFPRFFMIKVPWGQEWLIFIGLIGLALLLTEGIYRWSRSYSVRQTVRKILGKSREDILREEADRLRVKPRRLKNLRDRFQKRRKYRLRNWRRQKLDNWRRQRTARRQDRMSKQNRRTPSQDE